MNATSDDLDELLCSWRTADAYVAVRQSALGSAKCQRPWLRFAGNSFLLDTDRLVEVCVFDSVKAANDAIQNLISPRPADGYVIYPFVRVDGSSDESLSIKDCLRTAGGAIPSELEACCRQDDSQEYDVGLEQATVGDVVLVEGVDLYDEGFLLFRNFTCLRPDDRIFLSLGNSKVYQLPESVRMVRAGSMTRRYWEQNKDKWLSMPVRQASVGCSN